MTRIRIAIGAVLVAGLVLAFGIGWLVGAGRLPAPGEDPPFVRNIAAAPRIPEEAATPFFLRTVAQTADEVADLPAGAALPVVSYRMGAGGDLEPPCPNGWQPGRDEDGQPIFAPAHAHLIRLDGRVVDANGRAGPLVGRCGIVRIPLHPVCVKE